MTVPGSMIYGLRDVAAHLGIRYRQALYLVERGRLPVWREGKVICATRAALDAWLAAREAQARGTAA